MRRFATCAAVAACLLIGRVPEFPSAAEVAVHAQADRGTPQFRAAVDVIRLDVSVLDKAGRPVRGLTAADFTVLENGKPQRIVAVSEIDDRDVNPAPSARMRYARRDVSANDLSDQAADGRIVAVLIDDHTLPFDDVDIAMNARAAARRIIDDLGPADVAAVVFAQDPGKTEDFTSDRARLLAAIDAYQPHELPLFIERDPIGLAGPKGGDIQRFAPAYAGSECLRSEPTVPRLEAIVARLARVPQIRRKTVFYVGPGVNMKFDARGTCNGQLFTIMRDVFRQAQMANVNIHTIDPLGPGGYSAYAQRRRDAGQVSPWLRLADSRLVREWLQVSAENTGGVAVLGTAAIEDAIDRVIAQDQSYYLVGYQTSNGNPDGSYRTVRVKVSRPGLSVRTLNGYWAPDGRGRVNRDGNRAATAMELGGSGLAHPEGLPLRVTVFPIGPAPASAHVVVGVVLTPRVPAPAAPFAEQLSVSRTVYDAEGRTGTPVLETAAVTLPPALEAQQYDVLSRIDLAPGRYDLRLSAHSAFADATGGVETSVDVPDFAGAALTTTPIILGRPSDAPALGSGSLGDLLPIVPTTARAFAPSSAITALLRIFQGGAAPAVPVTVTTRILGADDGVAYEDTRTLQPTGEARGVDVQLPLPLGRLPAGPYVLSMEAALATGRTARQDLVFRVN